MRHFILLFILSITFSTLSAQMAQVKVRVLKRGGTPFADMPVVMKEKKTGIEKSAITNFQGIAVFTLQGGEEWSMSIKEMENFKTVYMPKEGTQQSSFMIVYDPLLLKRKQKPLYSRDTITFSEENQKGKRYTQATEGNTIVQLIIRNTKLSPITSRTVTLVSFKDKKKYIGRTNSIGEVRFNVPQNDTYEVDIHTDDFVTYIDVPDDGQVVKMKLFYQPTTTRETNVNDTITQDIMRSMREGTTGRVLVELHCKSSEGILLRNEYVWLNKIKDSIIYKAKTNQNGVARFLLPSSYKYMIHFEFQRDVDVVDLIRNYSGAFSLHRQLLTYRVNRALSHPEEFIPDTSELFIEEYTSFLTRQFSRPAKGPVGIHPKFIAKVNPESKEAVLEIGISSLSREEIAKTKTNAAPHNLCFVVDISGSMAGYDRIESLQEAMKIFVDKLATNDKVSLVAFNDDPEMVIPSQKAGNKTAIKKEITDLYANGGTNIYRGLEMGYKEIQKNYSPNSVNRVVLLSDGYGSVPVKDVLSMSKKYNDKGLGITTIGVGTGFNYPLMKSLSTAEGGMFYYASRSKTIFNAFAYELDRLINPVADECTIEIEYNSKIVYKILYGYEGKKHGGNKVDFNIGKIFPGMNSLAMVKFGLDKPTKEIENEPIIVRFSYKDLNTQKTVTEEHFLKLEWMEGDGTHELFYETEQQKLYILAVANQTMKVMSDLYTVGEIKKAYQELKSGNKHIKKLSKNLLDEDVDKVKYQLDLYQTAFERLLSK